MSRDAKHLKTIEQRLLWLSHWMIHHANHIRPKADGIKVGGHQASSASMVSILTARYFQALNSMRVEAAAKRIAADLNLARQNAMTKGGVAQGEWVSFYPANDNYKLHGDPDLDRPGGRVLD